HVHRAAADRHQRQRGEQARPGVAGIGFVWVLRHRAHDSSRCAVRAPYDPRMATTLRSLQDGLGEIGRGGVRWSVSWWHVVKVGALVGVLALAPSTYDRANRAALAR